MGHGTGKSGQRGQSEFFRESVERLSLYVKQLAWLHAVVPGKQKNKITHLERLEKSGVPIEYPSLFGYQYLIEWLFSVGPIHINSMGPSSLDFTEVYKWGERINITMWEAETLISLSKQYAIWINKGDHAAPYITGITDKQRDIVANKLKTALRAFKGVKNGLRRTRDKG